MYDYLRSLIPDEKFGIAPQNIVIEGYGELLAVEWALLDENAPAAEWQKVEIAINGHVIATIGDRVG